MKKVVYFLFLLFLLSGCSSPSNTDNSNSTSSADTSDTNKLETIKIVRGQKEMVIEDENVKKEVLKELKKSFKKKSITCKCIWEGYEQMISSFGGRSALVVSFSEPTTFKTSLFGEKQTVTQVIIDLEDKQNNSIRTTVHRGINLTDLYSGFSVKDNSFVDDWNKILQSSLDKFEKNSKERAINVKINYISSLRIIGNQTESPIDDEYMKKSIQDELEKTFLYPLLTVKSISLDEKETLQSFEGHSVLFITFEKPITLALQNELNPTLTSHSVMIDLDDSANNIIAIQDEKTNTFAKFSVQNHFHIEEWNRILNSNTKRY